jgi:tryptophanyl-tRNA synthetase
MSKSYDNAIYLSDTAETTQQKIRTMFTDPLKVYRKDPGHPDTCPVFGLHNVYNKTETAELEVACKNAELGCVDCKRKLTERMNDALAPMRERRVQLEENPKELDEILAAGADKARAVVSKTMDEVRFAMKMR